MTRAPRWTGRTVGVLGSAAFHVIMIWAAVVGAPYLGGASGGMWSGENTPTETAAATTAGADPSPFARASQIGVASAHARRSPTTVTDLSETPPTASDRRRLYLSAGRVIDHLWQSTVFAAVIALLTLLVRRNRARIRYALWLAASLKFLVPLTLIVSLLQRITWPAALRDVATPSLGSFVSGMHAPLGIPVTTAIWPAASSIGPLATRDWGGFALLALWAGGLVAVAAMRFRQWRRLEEIVTTSVPLTLPHLALDALDGSVEMRSTSGLIEPGVVGWHEPVLLMPAGLERHLTTSQMEAIVAHELCHVRRYDNLTACLHMMVEAICWFHPMVWWIGARLVNERERACDEHVLRTDVQPGDYARGILAVCKQYVASPLACVSGVTSANVRKRIDAILANRRGDAMGPWKTALLGAVLALMVIVPVGAAVTAPRSSPRTASRTILDPPTMQALSRARARANVRLDGVADYAVDGGATAVRTSAAPLPAPRAVYALTMEEEGLLGPNLRRSSRLDCWQPSPPGTMRCAGRLGPGELTADGVTPAHVAALLADALHARIEDRTGLTGRFTLRLAWTANQDNTSFLTAVRDQLGLRVVPIETTSDPGAGAR